MKHFWENESPPKEWNLGLISSIYKGKGDCERLKFHRGITVSSAISMVLEEAINQRMVQLIPFTQAQGGGKKGTSTRDHVFEWGNDKRNEEKMANVCDIFRCDKSLRPCRC